MRKIVRGADTEYKPEGISPKPTKVKQRHGTGAGHESIYCTDQEEGGTIPLLVGTGTYMGYIVDNDVKHVPLHITYSMLSVPRVRESKSER